MQNQVFAITDIETTGGGISGNRITEICIVKVQNGKVLEKFSSLINPEADIPKYITALTGIDNELVKDAPAFGEVAEEIDRFTGNTIFVAHNIGFDYEVLRKEFKNIGRNFQRRKLCTIRLSRKLIPNLLSYSLGRLCDTIGIPHLNPHRAEGDADATVILFQRLFSLDEGDDFKVFKSFLNAQSKQATLPPHLSMEQFDELPEEPGVYLFKNQKHKVIYVGKAKNIRKRVLTHFYEKKSQKYHLGQETFSIDFEETGNEFIAFLRESHLIQQHFPKYNRAQKKPSEVFHIIHYQNRLGIKQLAIAKGKISTDISNTFYSQREAIEALENLCLKFRLCPRFTSLQTNVEHCSHFLIKDCDGICRGEEKVETYNEKVEEAVNHLTHSKSSFAIHSKGRSREEISFVLIKEGKYSGFGFFSREESMMDMTDYEPFLKKQKSNHHIQSIIRSHLRKIGEKNVVFYGPAMVLKQDSDEFFY